MFDPGPSLIFTMWHPQTARWLAFVVTGIAVSVLNDRLRRSQHAAETSQRLQSVTAGEHRRRRDHDRCRWSDHVSK
jgi:hypothetical protein